MTAPALVKVTAPDPMAAVRALNRMRAAGFSLALENDRLMVEPLSRLTDAQRAYLRAHKSALVALLNASSAAICTTGYPPTARA